MRITRLAVIAVAASALVLGASTAASAATADPNEKITVTDIQYRISYSQEIPGNCAVLGFSQWQADKFRGWDAYQVAITVGTPPATRIDSFPVSPPPIYDDAFKYGGNTVSPPAGSHWVLIGNGSYRAGAPPADPDCTDMLARSQAGVTKVTTSFRRTDACATKFDKLTKAQKAVKKAKGKSKKAKSKAKKKLSKAEKSFKKDCSK